MLALLRVFSGTEDLPRRVRFAIHRALHELAVKILPQYEADDGPLSAAQIRQIKKLVPQGKMRSVRSSLFDSKPAKK